MSEKQLEYESFQFERINSLGENDTVVIFSEVLEMRIKNEQTMRYWEII